MTTHTGSIDDVTPLETRDELRAAVEAADPLIEVAREAKITIEKRWRHSGRERMLRVEQHYVENDAGELIPTWLAGELTVEVPDATYVLRREVTAWLIDRVEVRL